MHNHIGIHIKTIRKTKALTQLKLATKCGITQAAVSQIERGQRPKADTLNKICNYLDIHPNILYLMVLDRRDVPEQKRELFDVLWPTITELIVRLVG